jgi:hypothetical protein
MKHIITMDLGDGNSVLVEVDQPETEDTIDAGLPEMVHKAKETFSASVDKILPVSKVLIHKLHTLDPRPDEIEVAFGFNISIESGAVIASSNIGANFGILLRWAKSE